MQEHLIGDFMKPLFGIKASSSCKTKQLIKKNDIQMWLIFNFNRARLINEN